MPIEIPNYYFDVWIYFDCLDLMQGTLDNYLCVNSIIYCLSLGIDFLGNFLCLSIFLCYSLVFLCLNSLKVK